MHKLQDILKANHPYEFLIPKLNSLPSQLSSPHYWLMIAVPKKDFFLMGSTNHIYHILRPINGHINRELSFKWKLI